MQGQQRRTKLVFLFYYELNLSFNIFKSIRYTFLYIIRKYTKHLVKLSEKKDDIY